MSQIFFGSSPTGIEWDKIVAEIIITNFVFLRHPNVPASPFFLQGLAHCTMHNVYAGAYLSAPQGTDCALVFNLLD